MRFLFLFLVSIASAQAIGTLVQPDGRTIALGESEASGVRTLLFAPQTVAETSWILLPEGSLPQEVELAGAGWRHSLSFPAVHAPGLRFALEVPARLLSITLRGQFPQQLTLERSQTEPSDSRPWVVRSLRELRIDLPSVKIAEGWTPLIVLTRPIASAWQAIFSHGAAERTFSFRPDVKEWSFAPAAWGFQPTRLVIRGLDPRLSEVGIRALDAQTDLPADPLTLLSWPQDRWRDAKAEWFRWTGTSVLVLLSSTYEVQDSYLKRLAFYVEKTGFRGRVVSDEEMSHLHGWNAHDYSGPDLARFFTQAAQEKFTLNSSEIELRDRLVAAGVLVGGDGVWKAGTGALVGISVESSPALRHVLFVHEAFHGLYFTTPAFREGVLEAWNALSEAARDAFRKFLSLSRYDPSDEALMINEFQAYILQRPSTDWEGFFGLVVGSKTAAQLTTKREFLAAAKKIDSLVKALYGLSAGSVFLSTTSSGT